MGSFLVFSARVTKTLFYNFDKERLFIMSTTTVSPLVRLDPDTPNTLWHDQQFQWFVGVACVALIVAITEAVRVVYLTIKEELDNDGEEGESKKNTQEVENVNA